ncbi:MAG: hypothetical protein LC687_01750 [Actinobacteria bacterium]|nr:hypothetical protein [Actinomycetota bacterium]MCA1806576.1 hypothetical protein [Actinomycetota bacterium]
MSAYLDGRYFEWLYVQVCSIETENPLRSYRLLLHTMYTTEFVWLIPNDDNRVEDGKELRYEFLEDIGVSPNQRDKLWLDLGCSFLEMLVALSRRLSFEAGDSAQVWFWHMLENIGLADMNDGVDIFEDQVEETLNRVTWRTYGYNGGGGLFPLVYPEEDQRKVELWYQLSNYILEQG